MTNITDAFAVEIGTFLFKGGSYTPPSQWWVGLANGIVVSTAGVVSAYYELAGGAYARQAVTWGTIDSNGMVTNSAQVNFPQATIDHGTVTGAILCSANTGTDAIIAYQAFTTSIAHGANTRIIIPVGYLRCWY